MTDRSLILTADDFGLTTATSEAILRAGQGPNLSATSVLGNGPASGAWLARLRDHSALAVGLHGVLVGEDPPCLPARAIATLVDRRGRLASSWRTLLPQLVADRIDPDDVRRELEAQIDRISGVGIDVTHLDLHQHLQLWPSVATVVIDLARARSIPYVRVPRSASAAPVGLGVGRLADQLAASLDRADIGHNDGFLGLDEAGTWTGARLRRALGSASGSVVEVNLHPGPHRDPERHRYAWSYRWADELAALLDPRTARAVTDAGFTVRAPAAAVSTAPT